MSGVDCILVCGDAEAEVLISKSIEFLFLPNRRQSYKLGSVHGIAYPDI